MFLKFSGGEIARFPPWLRDCHIAYPLALIHCTCSSSLQSELYTTHANTPTAPSRFNNVIFRHHYVIQKYIGSTETGQRFLCRDLHFNRQIVMLITPLSCSLWHLLKISHWTLTIAWDLPRHVCRQCLWQCFTTFLGLRHPTDGKYNLRYPVESP